MFTNLLGISMKRRQEVTLYLFATLAIVVSAVIISYLRGRGCCRQTLKSSTTWQTGSLGDAPAFGELVWADTEDGIQLRFHYTLPEGTVWQPLVAPDGTVDSRQAASLRHLFGRKP